MIRTALARTSPLKRKARLKPRRSSRARSPAFLTFVRDLPCCFCSSRVKVEAHHMGERGLGQKASDNTAVPLCRPCHGAWHDASGPFKNWGKYNRALWADFMVGKVQAAWEMRGAT